MCEWSASNLSLFIQTGKWILHHWFFIKILYFPAQQPSGAVVGNRLVALPGAVLSKNLRRPRRPGFSLHERHEHGLFVVWRVHGPPFAMKNHNPSHFKNTASTPIPSIRAKIYAHVGPLSKIYSRQLTGTFDIGPISLWSLWLRWPSFSASKKRPLYVHFLD